MVIEGRDDEYANLPNALAQINLYLKHAPPYERTLFMSMVGDGYCPQCGHEKPIALICRNCRYEPE